MAGEIRFIGGARLRTVSQYTQGSAARVVGGAYLRTVSRYALDSGARVVGGAINTLPLRNGTLRIAGTLKLVGPPLIPAQRRVLLMERDSLRVVRSTYSNADGNYAFEKLASYAANYIVLGIDQTGVYNADVADNIAAGA